MIGNIFKAAMPPTIGVDIGSRVIHAVQWTGGWEIRHASVRRHTDEAIPSVEEVEDLVQALRRRGFAGNRVAVTAPDAILKSNILSLPPRTSGAPLERLAEAEMRNAVGDDSPFTMVSWDLPARTMSSTGTDLSVVACVGKDADPLIDAFEYCGLDVDAIDVSYAAAARIIQPKPASEGEMIVAIDIGHSGTRVSLILDTVVVYHRKMAVESLGQISEELAERLDIEADAVRYLLPQAIAEQGFQLSPWIAEVRRVFDSFLAAVGKEAETALSYGLNSYRDAQPGRLHLMGGGSEIPTFGAKLSEMLDLPLPTAHDQTKVPNVAPALVTAAGVARRGKEAA